MLPDGRALRIRVLAGADQVEDLGYPPGAVAKLRASLAEGWLAVAPGQPMSLAEEARVGWWLVDPATGQTVDELDDGRGAPEYIIVQAPGQVSKSALRDLAQNCLAGTAAAAAALLLVYVVWDLRDRLPVGVAFSSGHGAGGAGALAYEPLKYCVRTALGV